MRGWETSGIRGVVWTGNRCEIGFPEPNNAIQRTRSPGR